MNEISTEYVLSLGSNIGDREGCIRAAVQELSRISEIKSVSSFYAAEPWGKIDNSEFINIACIVVSDLRPKEFLNRINEIEIRLGRRRFEKWEPRIIDIDILLAGTEIIDENGLKIPHPYIPERRFVLVPLTEIAPDIIHPVRKKTAKELLDICPDNCMVNLIDPF